MNSKMNSYIWFDDMNSDIWFDILHDHEFIFEFILWIHIRFHDHEFIREISWPMNIYINSCIWRISWNHTWNQVYQGSRWLPLASASRQPIAPLGRFDFSCSRQLSAAVLVALQLPLLHHFSCDLQFCRSASSAFMFSDAITYASEPQLPGWDFCVSLLDLSELKALNFPSRAGHL